MVDQSKKKLDFGESNNVHWVWNALVYKNLIFYVDTTTNKVSSFSIGNVWVLP